MTRQTLDKLEDSALMALICERNHAAFTVLVERHSRKLFNVALRILGTPEEAEEIVQSTFLKLWRKADMWSPDKGAAPLTWLTRITTNACIDRRRKITPLPLSEDLQSALPDTHTPSPETKVQDDQTRKRVLAALSALSLRQRTAIELCYFQDLSMRDAAKFMNTTEKAVESLLGRGRAKMKDILLPMKEGSYANTI